MIFSITGKVDAVNADGFVLVGNQGKKIQVFTILDGEEIDITPGDELVVYGGPSNRRDGFSSSSAHKIQPNGDQVEIRINH